MIKIRITDTGAHAALAHMLQRMDRPEAGLKAIGELVTEFTKGRFAASQDPYGVPWAPNKPSTINRFLGRTPKNYTKTGGLSARGQRALGSKKPLIGESKSLSTQIRWQLVGNGVEIRSTMAYAAIQQFGGKKSQFGHLWGDIPARPFFPDAARGFPPGLANRILGVLAASIAG